MFNRNSHAMGSTRFKLIAGSFLLSGLVGTCTVIATDVFGGGAVMPAGAYVGFGFGTSHFSSNVPADPGAAIDSGSLFGHWADTTGNALGYCQTGSGEGKVIFNHVNSARATDPCTPLPNPINHGFNALPSVVDPHFAASDTPMSQQEFSSFAINGKALANTQPVQFPSVVGSIAITFNNPNVPGSTTLDLTDGAICRIFSGAITNWNQLSTAETGLPSVLPSGPLTVVYRSDGGNGTTFSLANHLSTVCGSDSAGRHFVTGEGFAAVVNQFLPTLPANWNGQDGNALVIQAISVTAGSIGYAESANLLASNNTLARIAKVNGKHPVDDLPDSLTFATLFTGSVINGVNADGTPHLQALTGGVAPQCMLIVPPASYANPATGYPIIGLSYLIANNTGNGTDRDAVRSLIGSAYADHTGVRTIGHPVGTGGTGYAFVRAPVAAARVNSCINS